MKTTKLVVGILMIVLSVFIMFQSMAAGFLNAVENKGATSGSAGVFMAIAYMVSGIVYLATKSKKGLGGDIANAIILGLIGIIALTNANKNFGDLIVWIILGFIIGFGFFIWHLLINKKNRENTNYQNNYSNHNQNQYQNNYGRNNQNNSQYTSRSQMHSRRNK